ncbi:MAG: bacterial transcriptional activator domain-containing protein [Gemmatimonadetes bacterium]|nr:bacterial transcriptional activator domain-containing protein [Gemmatimonadota bacterium]
MLRIHLSGLITIEGDDVVLGPRDFPGQQGRAAFAYMVGHRDGPVARGAVAEALWSAERPQAWETALSAIVSKLRGLLARTGVDGAEALRTSDGCYELHLPRGSWVDHEVAMDSIHEAEAALGAGDPGGAYGPSAVAHHIARRPFLPGQDGEWFEGQRDRLAAILVRALECRAEVYLWNGEAALGVEAAREIVRLRPFRETGYRLLMRAHTAAGNAAEALRVYERCRTLISEELGVPPSPETRALHAEVLQSL